MKYTVTVKIDQETQDFEFDTDAPIGVWRLFSDLLAVMAFVAAEQAKEEQE